MVKNSSFEIPGSGSREPTDRDRLLADSSDVLPIPSKEWGSRITNTFELSVGHGRALHSTSEDDLTIDLGISGDFAGARGSTPSDARGPRRYLVGSEIGRGGVGAVHEAWDYQLQREVAIKVLLDEHRGKEEVVRRFMEEARITSRLQHPGIVPIHEIGFSPDEQPFFVMRLVRGRTLKQMLGVRSRVTEELPGFLNILLHVCQTIAYAHRNGVIHRDLKPANIMVGAFGVVKVMDWGLAKVLGEPELAEAVTAARGAAELTLRCQRRQPATIDSDLSGTRLGTVFGTPAYLPPEQARGEIDRIDKRSDVFGLGAILCEIVTGSPPYTGSNAIEIYKKATAADTTEVIDRLNSCAAPLDLISLAKWCLSSDPTDRPDDATEVVEVIEAHMNSDQRRAEQDLIRFFELSLDLFCIASTEGFFLRVNQNFSRVLGFSVEELTARPFLDFVHPEDRDRTAAVCSCLALGEPCVQFLNRYRHADGHYLWFEWNAQVEVGERAIYAVARDVTERIAKR